MPSVRAFSFSTSSWIKDEAGVGRLFLFPCPSVASSALQGERAAAQLPLQSPLHSLPPTPFRVLHLRIHSASGDALSRALLGSSQTSLASCQSPNPAATFLCPSCSPFSWGTLRREPQSKSRISIWIIQSHGRKWNSSQMVQLMRL